MTAVSKLPTFLEREFELEQDAQLRRAMASLERAKRPKKRVEIPQSTELNGAGFVRIKKVLELIPVSRSTWYNGIRDGRFPKPIICGSCSMWSVEDLKKLIAGLKSA